MEKSRIALAFALSLAVMLVWQYFFAPPPPPPAMRRLRWQPGGRRRLNRQ